MVVYDQTHTMDGLYKGCLHINIFVIDYLFSTYEEDYLANFLSSDLFKALKEELEKRRMEPTLSIAYHQIFSFWIENVKDESILSLLAKEIKMGKLFTRSDLKSFKEQELQDTLEEFDLSTKGIANLTPFELYKVRSFQMCLNIMRLIRASSKSFTDSHGYPYTGSIGRVKRIKEYISTFGFSDYIVESDYFTGIKKENEIKFSLIDHQNE